MIAVSERCDLLVTVLKITFFGLTLSSSWGNGHATPYRAILRAFHHRGVRLTFYEKDVSYYAAIAMLFPAIIAISSCILTGSPCGKPFTKPAPPTLWYSQLHSRGSPHQRRPARTGGTSTCLLRSRHTDHAQPPGGRPAGLLAARADIGVRSVSVVHRRALLQLEQRHGAASRVPSTDASIPTSIAGHRHRKIFVPH